MKMHHLPVKLNTQILESFKLLLFLSKKISCNE